MATLYFGGYNYPGYGLGHWAYWPGNLVTIFGIDRVICKNIFLHLLFMWVRWTIPRFRYDQLMDLGWKTLIPLAIANIVLTRDFG